MGTVMIEEELDSTVLAGHKDSVTEAVGDWKVPVLAASAVFLISLAYITVSSRLPILWVDDFTRAHYALAWSKSPFLFPGDLVWLPAPMWFDGIAVWLGGNAWEPILVLNALCGVVAVVMVVLIAREMGMASPMGAGIIAAMSSLLLIVVASRLSEPKAWAFEMTGLWLWQKHITGRNSWVYLGSSICLTLAALCRYELWVFPLALFVFGLHNAHRGRIGLPVVLAGVIPFAVLAGTLLVMNYQLHGQLLYGGFTSRMKGVTPEVTAFDTSVVLRLVGVQSVLVVVGAIQLFRRRIKWERSTPFIVSLAILGIVVASFYIGFTVTPWPERFLGVAILPFLPLVGGAIVFPIGIKQRLSVGAVAFLAGLLGLVIAPYQDAVDQFLVSDDLRCATVAALSWRNSIGGVVVEHDGGDLGTMTEYAMRTTVDDDAPFAVVDRGVNAGPVLASYPFYGNQVLVARLKDTAIGPDVYGTFGIFENNKYVFEVACAAAPAYFVDMKVKGIPAQVSPGQEFDVEVQVGNRMGFPLLKKGPCAVNGVWVWKRVSGDPVNGEGTRFELPRTLGSDEEATCTISVEAPSEPGDYLLRFTMLQEMAAWFDSRPGFEAPEFTVTVR